MTEKLKEAESGCKSVEASLKNTEKQAEDQCQKRAAYQLGVEEMQVRLAEELSELCRDYCSIT